MSSLHSQDSWYQNKALLMKRREAKRVCSQESMTRKVRQWKSDSVWFVKVSKIRRGGDQALAKSRPAVNLLACRVMSPCHQHPAMLCNRRAWWEVHKEAEWQRAIPYMYLSPGFSLPPWIHIQLLNHRWKAADRSWQPVWLSSCLTACGPAKCTDFHIPKLESGVIRMNATHD